MFLYSHNENSEGAKELARAIGGKRIRHEGSTFKGASKKVVVNWGSSTIPEEVQKCRVLNPPEAIAVVANKLRYFESLRNTDVRVPEWTTDRNVAVGWVADNRIVVARTVLTGHSGNGIQFMEQENPDSFVNAPLYTMYVKKKDEYRIHFVGNNLIDIQRKALRSDVNRDDVNWRVRNLANGFVFVRNDVTPPADVIEQANRAARTSGLDFGAIDLIYNEREDQAYVLEINTAPGLQGTTVTNYATALTEYVA
jgi:glutathione synthase/RimK-type ligase-like ATP-grasp enzyme